MHKFYGDDIRYFIGVVEDVSDPSEAGRVKVRIFGLHTEDNETLPTDDLPWAQVMLPTTRAGRSGIGAGPPSLVIDSQVFGIFLDGKYSQTPLVLGSIMGIGGLSKAQKALPENANNSTIDVITTRARNLGEDVDKAIKDAFRKIVGHENAEKAFNFYVNNGYTEDQAAGIVGALASQSGESLDPNTSTSDAFGIGKWKGDRKKKLIDYASTSGRASNDLGAQLEFSLMELRTSHVHVNNELTNATTPSSASETLAQNFFENERVGSSHQTKANQAKSALSTGAGDTGNFPTGSATVGEGLGQAIATVEQLAEYLKKSSRSRTINELVVHHTATFTDQVYTAKQCDADHRARGFDECGYHFMIYRNGALVHGRNAAKIGAHAKGHNAKSIGISLVGGYKGTIASRNTTPVTDWTGFTTGPESQQETFDKFLRVFLDIFPRSVIEGHHDINPGKQDPGFNVGAYVTSKFGHQNPQGVNSQGYNYSINPDDSITSGTAEITEADFEGESFSEPSGTEIGELSEAGESASTPSIDVTVTDTTENSTNITEYNLAITLADYLQNITGETLGSLFDVDLTGIANDYVLKYNNGTNTWYAASGTSISALDDLSDVTITSPSTGDVLQYDGAEWVNGSVTLRVDGGDATGSTAALYSIDGGGA